MLKQCMGHFLITLEDPDLNVRRVALVAFNSAAHNKPMLVRDLLDQVLPKLYAETKIKVRAIQFVPLPFYPISFALKPHNGEWRDIKDEVYIHTSRRN